jgi:hypothetical protein
VLAGNTDKPGKLPNAFVERVYLPLHPQDHIFRQRAADFLVES